MDRDALRAGIRAAVAVTGGFAIGRYVLDEPQFAVFASFTALALLAYADYGGPLPARLTALGVTVGIALALVALGTVASESAWGGPLVVGVVTFVVAYSRVLGGYFVAGANAVILFVVLAAGIPVPDDALGWRLAGTAVGGALAAAATALMWPARPGTDLAPSLGRAAAALGACLSPGADREAALATARAEVRALRGRLGSGAMRPAEPTLRRRAGLRLVFDLDRLFGRIARTVRRPGPMPSPAQPLLDRSAAALSAAAASLGGARPADDPSRLASEVRAIAARVRPRLAAQTRGMAPADVAREVEDAVICAEVAHAACRAALDADVAARGRPAHVDPEVAPLLADRTIDVALRRLRTNLTLRSVHLRNAARVALALALALALVRAFELQHGFWVVLATLTVVQSGSSATGATARQVLLGTAIGFTLAMIVVLGAGTDSHIYAGLLAVVICGAVYAARADGLVAGQAGFTVLTVVLFGLLAPPSWTLALVRVEDVVVGAAVGVAIALLAWPRGASGQLPGAVADVVEAAVAEVRDAVRRALGGAHGPPPAALRQTTLRTTRAAEDDLAVALAERSPAGAPDELWPGLLADTGALWYSTSWVESLSSARRPPDGCDALRADLMERADTAAAGYRAIGDALREGRLPAAAAPIPDDADLVARCVAAAPADGPGREALMHFLALRSWVRELEAGVGRMSDRLRVAPPPGGAP